MKRRSRIWVQLSICRRARLAYRTKPKDKMQSFKIFTFATLMSFVLLFALVSQQQTGVEAGKKKMLRNALMAALLLHGGKKILLPLPIPLPVPILKQTQPVYYEQPHYQSYGGGGGY